MEDMIPEMISIVDDNGIEHTFEELDRVETESGKYVALIPVDDEGDGDEDSGELIILKVIEEDDEFYLEPIEDEKEFDEIGEIFQERLSEFFEFEE